MKNFLLIFLGVIAMQFTSDAQRGYEIGGWVGASQYYGELNANINFIRPGLAGGLMAKFNYNTRVISRISLSAGRLRGTDVTATNNFEKNRNLSFYSNVFELNAGFEFNFFNYVHNSRNENYTPYVTAGFSIIRFDPKAELDGETYSLVTMGTEGQDFNDEYLRITAGFSLGLGYKWDIAKDINLAVEGGMRFPMSDFIDDVSGVYPNYDELESLRGQEAVDLSNRTLNDIAGQTGKQRGNSTNNDKYLFVGISIMKYFGRLDCPKISKIQ